jgi:hypothetical protein
MPQLANQQRDQRYALIGASRLVHQASDRSPLEHTLLGIGLIATVIVTISVTRIARRELSKAEVNQ